MTAVSQIHERIPNVIVLYSRIAAGIDQGFCQFKGQGVLMKGGQGVLVKGGLGPCGIPGFPGTTPLKPDRFRCSPTPPTYLRQVA